MSEFIGKVFPEPVMSPASGMGEGIEQHNGVEVRDAGSAGNRTGLEYTKIDEVTFVSLKDGASAGERITLDGSGMLVSPALRKGLTL